MLKMVFLVHRRPDMDEQEFHRYWRDTHGPIARQIPGLRKYVQNHSTAAADGTRPPYDGFAEMWFDSADSFATPEFQAALADTPNFLDVERVKSLSFEQVEFVTYQPMQS